MTAPFRTATPSRLALVAAALAILATLIVRPAFGPAGARAMGPLPDCRYDDILTTPRGYGDWSVTLVDTILRVPKSYAPPDLVSTSQAGIPGGGKVRSIAIDDLRAMAEAAAAAGNAIGVESAYRSYAEQVDTFNSWVKRYGVARARQVSARPGHSEHQLGLAIDFRSEPGGSPFTGTWGTSPAGKWMKAHAWEYGWVMSYPKGTIGVVCYDYEPWHFRYVGRSLAALIHDSGLTLREYLWTHFTTTVVPAAPSPTKAPASTPRPTARPTAAPTTEPSPTAVTSPSASLSAPTAAPAASPTPPFPTEPVTPFPTEAPPGAEPVAAVSPVAAAAAAGAVLLLGAVGFGAWFARRRVQR